MEYLVPSFPSLIAHSEPQQAVGQTSQPRCHTFFPLSILGQISGRRAPGLARLLFLFVGRTVDRAAATHPGFPHGLLHVGGVTESQCAHGRGRFKCPPLPPHPSDLMADACRGGGASSPLPSRQAEEWQVVQHCKHWRRITCHPAARSHLTWWVIASTAFASTMSSSHAPSPLAVCVATVEAIRPAHVSVQDRRMQRGRRSASQGSPKWSF
jgi:hypothetical protein